ncbi:hypothetical protein D9619_003798 [Psilocybe cf. subviscida]|uniref:F-box domain-containing protein n=1 Tax=Psilocybe cf. subviscida TaxID=2480587 RepID=A0A8H5AWK6_9AGAR|nr:hypothetical protein D9619_003798 [Psilocybe cf. subviscida]
MFLERFPTEVTLLAICRLPLASIIALRCTCTAWNDFIRQNINAVYRSAAFVEGFIAKSDALLSELTSDPSGGYANLEGPFSRKVILNVNNWEELCKRYKEIRGLWLGHGPSRLLSLPRNISSPTPFNAPTRDHHKRIHRFKVDEQLGLLIATTKRGGLIVKDLDTDELLWELPQAYVHGNAHLEYERGYIVFDRTDGGMEVWRRTEDVQVGISQSRSAGRVAFKPTHAQLEVVRLLQEATLAPPSPKAAAARFSPVGILSLPAPPGGRLPEHMRPMFRLLFPFLLVVRFKTAYVINITTGKVTETFDDIHRVHRVGVPEYGTERDEELPRVSEDAQLTTPPPREDGQDAEDDDDDDFSDSDDEQDAIFDHPVLDIRASRALVSIDLSPRHVLIVWRNDLLVFSRKTGICVLKMDSRMMRYGMWRWDLMPLYKNANADGNATENSGESERDSHRGARAEGREVVPMPVQISVETKQPSTSGKKLHDRFTAAQFSRDGRHLTVLLSGSRLIIVRDFEAVLVRHRIPPPTMDNFINMYLRLATKKNEPSTKQYSNEIDRQLDREDRVAQQARDRDLFANTLEVQLGSPRKSYGMHLAYAHGRIGVVTSNAVYVVTPPAYLRDVDGTAMPNLKVVRVPHFVNPSWLGGVGSLVLSDTSLYLNWNSRCQILVPTKGGGVNMMDPAPAVAHATGIRASVKLVQYIPWDVERNTSGWFFRDIDEESTIPPEDVPAAGAQSNHAAGDGDETSDGDSELVVSREEKYRRIWERDYLHSLRGMENHNMDELYLRLPGQRGWIIAHSDRCLEIPQESTVYAVEFAPKLSSTSAIAVSA